MAGIEENDDSSYCNLWEEAVRLLFEQDGNNNPFVRQLVLLVSVVPITYIVSTITDNYSQVDKLWSIMPVLYTWLAICDNARTRLMAVCVTIWGIRLTYNFHRRGGYKWPQIWTGDEDYRWKVIRNGGFLKILQTNNVAWNLFNLLFISLYQNVLLWLIASPSLVAYTAATACANNNKNGAASSSLNAMDVVATVLFLSFVVIEAIADNQQFAFYTEKYRRIGSSKSNNKKGALTGEFADGFKSSGLFAIVRKPNYAAEQAIWISFFLFSIASTHQIWNWSIVGWILLVLLFQTSGWFTEKISKTKYPRYEEYMKCVPLYLPNPFQILVVGYKSSGSVAHKSD